MRSRARARGLGHSHARARAVSGSRVGLLRGSGSQVVGSKAWALGVSCVGVGAEFFSSFFLGWGLRAQAKGLRGLWLKDSRDFRESQTQARSTRPNASPR